MSWWNNTAIPASSSDAWQRKIEENINAIGERVVIELNQFKDVVNRCTAYEDHVQKLEAELTHATTVIGKHLKTLDDDLARIAITFRVDIDKLTSRIKAVEHNLAINTNRKKKP